MTAGDPEAGQGAEALVPIHREVPSLTDFFSVPKCLDLPGEVGKIKGYGGQHAGRVGSKQWVLRSRHWGFLLYVTHTYPMMVPYIKGMHLTLEGWREGRDLEGWKLAGCKA